jgi:hypothetical protein
VTETFGAENVLDVEENVFTFRQLVGLEDQLPFECIGEAKEAAFYMKMAAQRGYRGRALTACEPALPGLDIDAIMHRYLATDFENANIPASIRTALQHNYAKSAERTRAFIGSLQEQPLRAAL